MACWAPSSSEQTGLGGLRAAACRGAARMRAGRRGTCGVAWREQLAVHLPHLAAHGARRRGRAEVRDRRAALALHLRVQRAQHLPPAGRARQSGLRVHLSYYTLPCQRTSHAGALC